MVVRALAIGHVVASYKSQLLMNRDDAALLDVEPIRACRRIKESDLGHEVLRMPAPGAQHRTATER